MYSKIILFLVLVSTSATAHEWTPTYPKLKQAYVDGLLYTKMQLFNKRKEIQYYTISVHDEEWNNVPFATANKIIGVKYLAYKQVEIYIRETDKNRVTYICSTSKLLKKDFITTGVSSRICSKVK